MDMLVVLIAAASLTFLSGVRTSEAAVLGDSNGGATMNPVATDEVELKAATFSVRRPAGKGTATTLSKHRAHYQQLLTEYDTSPTPPQDPDSNLVEPSEGDGPTCDRLRNYVPNDAQSESLCDGIHVLYTRCCAWPANGEYTRGYRRTRQVAYRSTNDESSNSTNDPSADHTPVAEAYGYGFLLVAVISLVSLLGIAMVPFLRKGTRLGHYYKYIYALLIALGASSLFCDAILHLIPHAFNLHEHEDDDHEAEETDEKDIIWKGCAVIAGAFFTFLLETILHSFSAHGHGHTHGQLQEGIDADNLDHPDRQETTALAHPEPTVHVTMPHGSLSCSYAAEGGPPAIMHPKSTTPCAECPKEEPKCCEEARRQDKEVPLGTGVLDKPGMSFTMEQSISSTEVDGTGELNGSGHYLVRSSSEHVNKSSHRCGFIRSMKPLAWMIILGDGMHNLADGIALGVAISQSLGLGLGTALAILFHEIPHEIGDYVILLSTGMKWYAALFLNFVSALTAVAGFFVGVAVGTESEEAQNWILAVTAGQFLYIAFVDLLPELIHSKEKGRARFGQLVLSLIGLSIGFVILLVIALYEEELDSLLE